MQVCHTANFKSACKVHPIFFDISGLPRKLIGQLSVNIPDLCQATTICRYHIIDTLTPLAKDPAELAYGKGFRVLEGLRSDTLRGAFPL